MHGIKTRNPKLLIALAFDTVSGLERAYSEFFVEDPPGLMVMESEEEYKEELKNAILTKKEINPNNRPACDIVEQSDKYNFYIGVKMARLTSRQRQAVIARYLAGESIASLAKEYNISRQALAKQVKQEKVAESLQKVTNEQALTMAAFIQSKKEQTQDIIEALLDKLQDKIDKASFKDCNAGIRDLASLYLEREDNSIDNTVKVVIERKVQDLTDETDNE